MNAAPAREDVVSAWRGEASAREPYDAPLILAYHSVNEARSDPLAVHPRDFEHQMRWLHTHGYRSVTLGALASTPPAKPSRTVVVTFDDGYADNCDVALPILQRYGFVATVFLVSDLVDTTAIHRWDVPRANGPLGKAPYRLLDRARIETLANAGFEFGSHSCTHARLTAVPRERCWDEIARSRRDLERILGREVRSFCYPEGALDDDVIGMVAHAGYTSGVVTPPQGGIPYTRWTRRRVGIYQSSRSLLFRIKVALAAHPGYESVRWCLSR